MAKIIENSTEALSACADLLKSGGLVAFPTETVYGLGASLWQEDALHSIFYAKERPKTDPLIVHVQNAQCANPLISPTQEEKKLFDVLAKKFWPGPLTIVVKSSALVPKIVMAGGEYVGIRVPSHPVAQELLVLSQIPIAAPSANKFGHVSPTKAHHVLDDLNKVKNLIIIDDNTFCNIGIESTVVKIKGLDIQILRPGAISGIDIEHAIYEAKYNAILSEKPRYIDHQIQCEKTKEIQNVSRETFSEDSPGQCLTHYSPWIDTFIIFDSSEAQNKKFPVQKKQKIFSDDLKHVAILDFGKKNLNLKANVLLYFDLSTVGNYSEAAQNLFFMLRKIEKTPEVKKILITNLCSKDRYANAIFDRIYRAASGKFIEI